MIREKQRGFTLIEALSALAIGGVVTANQIKQKNFELEDSLNKNIAKDLSVIFSGINARMEVDTNLVAKWSSVPSNLSELKSSLRGVNSSCTYKSWNPDEISYKVKSLIPCSGLLNNKIYGFDINFDIQDADADGKVDKILVSLNRGGRAFTQKNIRDFELLMKRFLESFDKNRIFFNAGFKSLNDGSEKDLLTCLASPNSCTPVFEFNADGSLRSYDNDYLRLDGTNGIRSGGVYFQKINATNTAYEFKECDKWAFNPATGNVEFSSKERCGFTHDGYIFLEKDLHGANLYSQGINSNAANIKDIDSNTIKVGDKIVFKSKSCFLKTNRADNTIRNTASYSCGLYKNLNGSGDSVLLTEVVNAEDAYINTGYIEDLFSNEINAKTIFSDNINVSGKITTNDLETNYSTTNNLAKINKLGGNLEITKAVSINTSCSGNAIGSLARTVNGYIVSCQVDQWGNKSWQKQENCPRWQGNLNYLTGLNGADKGCINGYGLANAPTSSWLFVEYIRHSNNGNYHTSQTARGLSSGVAGRVWVRSQTSSVAGSGWTPWKELGVKGESGQYAYFNRTTCPAGWVPANGQNGTRDLRGEFIRGWDAGRGVDRYRGLGSWQDDTMANHYHGTGAYSYYGNDDYFLYMRDWNGAFYGRGLAGEWNRVVNKWYNTYDWNGYRTRTGTTNQFQVNDSTETKPRNVALLACVKL